MSTIKQKSTAKNILLPKTKLGEELSPSSYSNMTQEEVSQLYMDKTYEYDTEKIDEVLELDNCLHVHNLFNNYGLTNDEARTLIKLFLLNIWIKSKERDVINNRAKLNPDHRTNVVLLEEAIHTMRSDYEAMKLIDKMLHHNSEQKIDVELLAKRQIELIGKVIFALEIQGHDTQTWVITNSAVGTSEEPIDKFQRMTRVETNMNIVDLYVEEGKLNIYPLLSKEKIPDHTMYSKPSDYMLKNGVQQDDDIIELLNTFQNIPWSINSYANKTIPRNTYASKLEDDYSVKMHQKLAGMKASRVVMEMEYRQMLAEKNELFFNAKYDSRGRLYLYSYLLNLQGSTFEKQTLMPHKSLFKDNRVTDNNRKIIQRNMYIAFAMAHGHDKISFDERENKGIYIFNLYQSNNTTPPDDVEMYPTIMYLYDEIIKMKLDKNYYPVAMVGLDGTNQGLQLYAVLAGDKATAQTCNLANGSARADAYGMLANELNKGLSKVLVREDCKDALMKTMYGMRDGWAEIIRFLYPRLDEDKARYKFCLDYGLSVKLVVKNNDTIEFEGILKLRKMFNDAMTKIAPVAMTIMAGIIGINKSQKKEQYTWVLPDGFNAVYRVKREVSGTVEFNRTSKTKSKWTFPYKFDLYASDEDSRGLAANIIQSIDGYVLREVQRKMIKEGAIIIKSIHDAFYCHPEHMDLMVLKYKEVLCEILDSDLLDDLLFQLTDKQNTVRKNNTLLKSDIINSEYPLS